MALAAHLILLHTMKNLVLLILLFLTVKASGQNQTRKVLFLGNSYTYVNDLPYIISELAASVGDVLVYDSHLIGGYTLEDHFASTVSLNKIRSQNWDYIILQEQSQRPAFIIPSGFMNGFNNLTTFIKANKPCAQVMSFMTWGYKNGDTQNCSANPAVCTYDGMQSQLTNRYVSMSDLFESEITPVGVVWKHIRENYPSIELYQADGSHPSVAGSYLAACCFYATIFRKNPGQISNNYGLDANTASIIRNVAKTLVFDQMEQWYIGRYVPVSDFDYVIGTGHNEIKINRNETTYRNSFIWDFGDGTTATDRTPTHSYSADGTYTIRLTSYKCFLGQNIESVFERTVNFCAHTNTIYPNLLLCPDETGTLWTQPADSYQWYDETSPINGATNQSLQVEPGRAYRVLTTVNGCSEMSSPMLVDSYMNTEDCRLRLPENKAVEATIFPNPVKDILTIRTNKTLQEISVYDMTGKRITVNQVSPYAYDVSGILNGMYFLRISLENGSYVSTKFIKE